MTPKRSVEGAAREAETAHIRTAFRRRRGLLRAARGDGAHRPSQGQSEGWSPEIIGAATILGGTLGGILVMHLIMTLLQLRTGSTPVPPEPSVPPAPPPTRPVRGVAAVRVVTLDSPDVNYTEYALLEEPVILRGSVLQSWDAYAKWTPDYLASTLPEVSAYTRSTPEFITWHDNKPLEPFVHPSAGEWGVFNTMRNVSSRDALHTAGPPFHYVSDDILELQARFPSVVQDLQPLRPLAVTETGLQVNLWFGSVGLQTYMHYDASFNAFAQLHGRKRFTLFPPTAAMYPWPCLHPHIGHSQVDWRDAHARDRFPKFDSSGAIVVEVGRGDVLMVPPYFWHHVEVLDAPSVSVNVWSDAPAYALLDDAYTIPLPIESDWEASTRVATAAAFLRIVISSVLALHTEDFDVAVFAADLYDQRWRQLLDKGHLIVDSDKGRELCSPKSSGVVVDQAKLEARAASLHAQFALMGPIAVRQLSLGNYVERVASAVVEPVLVGHFIQNCLGPTQTTEHRS